MRFPFADAKLMTSSSFVKSYLSGSGSTFHIFMSFSVVSESKQCAAVALYLGSLKYCDQTAAPSGIKCVAFGHDAGGGLGSGAGGAGGGGLGADAGGTGSGGARPPNSELTRPTVSPSSESSR